MPAYITVDFTPKNTDLLKEYSAKAAPTIAEFQGEFLVKGPSQALNGSSDYQNQVIIVFPSRELAENWYSSPQYQALLDLRDQGMSSNFQLVG